jgi:hypothetical protein
MRKILSYTTPNEGPNIKLTKGQIQALRKANLWPCHYLKEPLTSLPSLSNALRRANSDPGAGIRKFALA